MARQVILYQENAAMGYRIECVVTIAAPVEWVWRTIQDPERRTEWDERVVSERLLKPGGPGKGNSFRITYSAFGVRFWGEMEYILWNPPTRSAIKAVRFSRFSMIESAGGTWHVFQGPDGATVYSTTLNIAMGGGPLAPLLERVFIGGYFRHITERSLNNVKSLIEREYEKSVQSHPAQVAV
jgi:Polyketide cyclase / dehydrase and lipid transport